MAEHRGAGCRRFSQRSGMPPVPADRLFAAGPGSCWSGSGLPRPGGSWRSGRGRPGNRPGGRGSRPRQRLAKQQGTAPVTSSGSSTLAGTGGPGHWGHFFPTPLSATAATPATFVRLAPRGRPRQVLGRHLSRPASESRSFGCSTPTKPSGCPESTTGGSSLRLGRNAEPIDWAERQPAWAPKRERGSGDSAAGPVTHPRRVEAEAGRPGRVTPNRSSWPSAKETSSSKFLYATRLGSAPSAAPVGRPAVDAHRPGDVRGPPSGLRGGRRTASG